MMIRMTMAPPFVGIVALYPPSRRSEPEREKSPVLRRFATRRLAMNTKYLRPATATHHEMPAGDASHAVFLIFVSV